MKQDYFSENVKNLLDLLDKHNVRYVIVDVDAVIYYGYARLTGDTDVFYGPTYDNVRNLFKALNEFWGGEVPGIDTTS